MKSKIVSVIGAGKWGTALHFAIKQQQECFISSHKEKKIEDFISLEKAFKSSYIIMAISAQHTHQFLKENFQYSGQKILVASKGIDANNYKFLEEIYLNYIPKENLGFLSGPSFASEVMQSLPSALVINSSSKDFFYQFKPFFPSYLKMYYSDDIIGAEIAGAYKNVLAIASGIVSGLQLGYNAQASLISRGLIEMNRFGKHFGAKEETFLGLSGAGDLFLTASHNISRNFRVGLGLAEGKPLHRILQEIGEVAEGIETSKAIANIANQHNIYTPIVNEIYAILLGKSIHKSIEALFQEKDYSNHE
jgi:glycerol-3-phosphate dehydrogenase (NAD(P)+)